MTDIPGTSEPTSGPLAWVLLIPILAVIVGLPFVVFSAVLFGVLLALHAVVGVPTVTLGLFEALGLPGTVGGIPTLYVVAPALLGSLALLYWTGGDWSGTDSTPDSSFDRFR